MNKAKKKPKSKRESEKEYETILLAEIARRPFLYDRNHEYYSEIQLRKDSWQEIAEHLNKTVDELKRKWETLRDSYRKFCKKLNNHELEGNNEIKWVHYDNMKFLSEHIKLGNLSSEQAELQAEFDSKLIAEVVKHKNLYDSMNESFRNMKERAKTWEEISNIVDAFVDVCKKRWHYLRKTFRNFNKKETIDKKEINWIHYDSLKFLLEYDSGNVPDLRPPHTYNPSKPDIPLEFKNLPPLTDTLKSDNESENMDCSDFKNLPPFIDLGMKSNNELEHIDCSISKDILEKTIEIDNLSELSQKCGEIIISRNEKFSYKCCFCDEKMEYIEKFTNHIIDNHLGKNGTKSIFENQTDNLVKNEVDEDFFNDNENQISIEDPMENSLKGTSVPVCAITKTPLKYIKNVVKTSSPTEEDLKENPDDDPETAALKRIKRQNKLVKIEKIGKYPCSTCSFSFDKEENLKKHEETHRKSYGTVSEHKKEIGIFTCDECERKFQYRYQLQRHKRVHTGERPYQCTICEQKFRHYYTLKEHYIFRHSDDRPFACRSEGCDKKFKTKKTRATHEVQHSTDLPFQCDECGKCFPRNSYLKRHRNTWHMDKNDRPYKCPHCPKSFCTQHNLKYHIYTHTGERPFGCPVCPSKFSKPWTIKEHMKIHSGERNYVCPICSKDFARPAHLIRHKKIHERVTVPST